MGAGHYFCGYSAILLASGLSRRYGAGNKLLADFSGQPLAAHAANLIGQAGFDRAVAVIHKTDFLLAALLAEAGLKTLPNPCPERGQGAALARGAAYLAHHPPGYGIFVLLADMPRIEQADLCRLAGKFKDPKTDIAMASNGSTALPPVLLRPALLPRMQTLTGDRGVKTLIAAAPNAYHIAALPLAPAHLIDLDDRDDFAKYGSK